MTYLGFFRRLGKKTRASAGVAGFHIALDEMRHGRYQSALSNWTTTREFLEETYGLEHPWVLRAVAYQAYCLLRLDRPAHSVTLYEYVLQVERRLNGESRWSRELEAWLSRARERATTTDPDQPAENE